MWFRSKKLEDALNQTKKVKVEGVKFEIKKINVLDYANGSSVMLKIYDTYKTGDRPVSEGDFKKIREHYRDVIMAGVIDPKLKRKDEEGEGIFIDKLLEHWDMAEKVYGEIINYTYGKKKVIV